MEVLIVNLYLVGDKGVYIGEGLFDLGKINIVGVQTILITIVLTALTNLLEF